MKDRSEIQIAGRLQRRLVDFERGQESTIKGQVELETVLAVCGGRP